MSDLERFVEAQEPVIARVLQELTAGRKESHWMWFVFPQIAGLGMSAMSQRFAIRSRDEAIAYRRHGVLGPRLAECARLLLRHDGVPIREIMGAPDDQKLRSSMTLFRAVDDRVPEFQGVLDTFFDGAADERTLELLEAAP